MPPITNLDPHTAPAHPSLYAMLAARARASSDGHLAFSVALGAIGTVAIVIAAPRWWIVAFAFATLGAFGGWGIVDRIASERPNVRAAAIAARALTILGTVTAIVALLGSMGFCLGTWKS